MLNKKQLYLVAFFGLLLSLALVKINVWAAWSDPGSGPGGTSANPLVSNPLSEDLDLGGKKLTNGASAAFDAGVFSSLDLKNGNITNVGKINGFTPGAGGLTNPLVENIDGNDKQYIEKLMSCNPAKNEVCGAVEGQAGKSTFSNSFSAGLYGYTQAASGAFPSYGVYGLAMNTGGYGVYGLARERDAVGGYFQNSEVGGKALVTSGLTELNGNLNVIGNADVSNNLNVAQNATVTGNMITTGTTRMEGLVTIDNGVNIEGALRVDISPVSLNSAIVGNADGTTYANNAGVEGQGTVGVYGNGHLVGVFGLSGGYGGIFRGSSAEGWNPPPGGGMDDSGINDLGHGFISKLFGIEKTHATLNTPGPIGVVAAGGWLYDGSFSKAGLGVCALSGEKAREVENSYGGDFFEYCQDDLGANNFAGFFSGNVYVKDGSIQFNDSLAINSENLIYGNASSAVAGSHLLKLQTAGADKFKVDKDGAATFSNLILNKTLGAGESLIFSNLNALTSGNLIDLQVGGSSKFRVTRDGITTFGSSLTSPANLTLSGNSSVIRFSGNGTTWPSCASGTEGALYYGKTNHVLCICNGANWQSLDNEYSDSACSNTSVPPVPLH